MGFKFKKDIIILDIEGNQFEIEYNEEFSEKCLEFSKRATMLSKEIEESKDSAEAVRKTCDLCKETINTITGTETASEKIFAGRKDDMFEHMDVVMYIFDEVEKYKQAKIDKLENFANRHSLEQKSNKQRGNGKKNK